MATPDGEMTLRDYGTVVARRRLLVITSVLVAVIVAILLSALQTPIYQASSDVLIQPRGEDALFAATESLGRRAIQTEIVVVQGEPVRERVQQQLGLAQPPPDPTVRSLGDTDVIQISVADSNATNAATYATAYALAYIDIRREQSIADLLAGAVEIEIAIDELQTKIDSSQTDRVLRETLLSQQSALSTTRDQLRVDAALRTGGATIIKPAELPTTPVEPTPTRDAVLAAIAGLIIGLGAAFLIDYFDDKVGSIDDLDGLTDQPVLVQVPIDRPSDDRPVSLSEPGHPSVESYRGLRTNLQFLALDRPLRVVHVTSSIPGEGKTTTATNLAVVLAHAGHRVALVDADLRRPRIHVAFDIRPVPGLTELLLGSEPRDVVRHVDVGDGHKVSVYPCGNIPSSPSEMLSSKRMRTLLAEMGGHYDYVVVDSAPILPVSDSMAIAAASDGVLVVVQADHVTKESVTQTLDRLQRVSAPVLGLVLNKAVNVATEYEYQTASVVAETVDAPRHEPAVTSDA